MKSLPRSLLLVATVVIALNTGCLKNEFLSSEESLDLNCLFYRLLSLKLKFHSDLDHFVYFTLIKHFYLHFKCLLHLNAFFCLFEISKSDQKFWNLNLGRSWLTLSGFIKQKTTSPKTYFWKLQIFIFSQNPVRWNLAIFLISVPKSEFRF